MPGPSLAVIVVSLVVAACIFGWAAMVSYADRHPRPGRRGGAPDREGAEDIFRGEGRPVFPQRDASPDDAKGVRDAAQAHRP